MLNSLLDLISESNWTYGILFLFAALDAVIPIVPSETAVVAAGVLAANGHLRLELIIVSAAAGAIVGDNIGYLLGRTLEPFVKQKLFAGDRRSRLDWAERALRERGGYLIIIARFIPGGRTATTVGAGVLRYPWPRFFAFDFIAGILWGTYAALIGYFGGKAFEDSPIKGILLALAIAFGIAAAVEGFRYVKRRRLAARTAPRPEKHADHG